MRLLLDECVPARLRGALPEHQVSNVVLEGWSGIKSGKLLAPAASKYNFTSHTKWRSFDKIRSG